MILSEFKTIREITMNQEMMKKAAWTIAPLALAGAFATSVNSCIQHDWRIHNGFRSAVLQNPTPRLLTVETDGVTREGFLNRGAADTQGPEKFIVAQSKEAACWYTTLRVTKGQENLPFLQKIFGGAEYEEMFANQAFHDYTCRPIANQKTIEDAATQKPAP